MQVIRKQDLKLYSKEQLKRLVVETSQQLFLYDKVNRRLEKHVGLLTEELGAKNQQVLFTAQALGRMGRWAFGDSSEKREKDTSPLFGKSSSEKDAKETTPKPKPHKPRRGRTPQPHLQEEPIHHRYGPEDVRKHGLIEWEGQTEDSELITVVPSRIIKQIHKRQKYFQTDSITGMKKIVTAPGPLKVKEGSRYSLEFGVETGLAKYQWHLPLDRQVKMFSEQGLRVTSQTLFDQIDTIAWYLRPTVFKKLIQDIEASDVNQADDTTWKNLENKEQRERKRFYMWGVTNSRSICFNIYDSRNREVVRNFLGSLKGVLVSDGLQSFKALASDDLKLANDWYHVRRKFIKSESSYPQESKFFIDKIRELSEIESEIQGKPPDEIAMARDQRSKLIIEDIRRCADSLGHVLPRSSIGLALGYMNRLWDGLIVFLDDPRVPMHTNDIEREMRGPAVGRKNHFGSKSMTTARIAAVWYSIVGTCKLNNISPRDYIADTLQAILNKKPYKMPWEYAPTPTDSALH